uniref:Uncharacterized protein n=1 Tax=Ignisphaera aggregans TaxID=334771 RepID=A0A7C4BCJ8_9CREN
MSFIVGDFERASAAGSKLVEKAKEVLLSIVAPDNISRAVVEKLFRKALRVGAWSSLKPEQKALILALRKWRGGVRSRNLLEVVKRIFLEVELFTFRGRALLYGVAIAIKNGVNVAKDVLNNTGYILATGIMYLNNPPMLRVYG